MTRTLAIVLLAVIALSTSAIGAAASSGPAQVVVDPVWPCVVRNLQNSTVAQARQELVGSSCRLGTITKRYPRGRHGRGHAKQCPRGAKLIVTRQRPKPLTVAPTNSKVDITLTCGRVPRALS